MSVASATINAGFFRDAGDELYLYAKGGAMSRVFPALKGSFIACRMAASLLLIFLLIILLTSSASFAQGNDDAGIELGNIPYEVIAVLKKNDFGGPLIYPNRVMFDPSMDETYVLSGDRIVVFGSDYYPFIALGKGRGAVGTTGMAVDRNGYIYLCQSRTLERPGRVTIFNAAFFPVREIFFKGFEGAEEFSPYCIAVSQDGEIYVAGVQLPGVLVMDQNGKLLRWLRPRIKSFPIAVRKGTLTVDDEEKENSASQAVGDEEKERAAEETESVEDESLLGLPAGLIPKQKVSQEEKEVKAYNEQIIVDIDIDQEGHLYLLSENASKIFVYSANEQFLFSFGTKGGSSGKLSRPRGLAVDEKRKCVYVIDYMRQTLLIYNLAGKFMQEFGGMGWSPGWFNYPTDVALDRKGNVIISDLYNQRVQVLDIQFRTRFQLFGEKQQPEEVKEAAESKQANEPQKDKPVESNENSSPVNEASPAQNGPPAAQQVNPDTEIIEEPIGALKDD